RPPLPSLRNVCGLACSCLVRAAAASATLPALASIPLRLRWLFAPLHTTSLDTALAPCTPRSVIAVPVPHDQIPALLSSFPFVSATASAANRAPLSPPAWRPGTGYPRTARTLPAPAPPPPRSLATGSARPRRTPASGRLCAVPGNYTGPAF